MKYIIIFAFLLSCTDVKKSTEFLIENGYQPVKVGGHCCIFDCGKGPYINTKFLAYKDTLLIKGCVCSGGENFDNAFIKIKSYYKYKQHE